jgi:peptidoglycan L-alanyl-D-glutamate endopeptidase CwlK
MFPVFVVVAIILIYLNRKKFFFEMDNRTLKNLETLNPILKDKLILFFEEVNEKGLPALTITDAIRTPAEQQKLYNQGRTTAGAIVTNARPWDSLHNYGLAVDCYQTADLQKGKLTAPTKEHAKIAQKYGIVWGGSFLKFKDLPHFEFTQGLGSKAFITKYKPQAIAGTLPKDAKGKFIFK